jgi:hypothetical protein
MPSKKRKLAENMKKLDVAVKWLAAPSGKSHAFALSAGKPDETSLCGLSTTGVSVPGILGVPCPRCYVMTTGRDEDAVGNSSADWEMRSHG